MRVDLQFGRPGLAVPQPELLQVETAGIGHRLQKIVGRRRLAVVALQVEPHAVAKQLGAEQGLVEADDLGPLVVNGGGVEVVDLHVGVGADRVRHGAGVLGKLGIAQQPDVVDALDRPAGHVGGELLVAKDGQPLLEGELEPVAAGDAVAGPVVEVFVPHHLLDRLEVGVGRRVGPRQNVLGVEDVQALVLHRPHVEGVDRQDHVDVEVVFEAVDLLVPAHRLLQRAHGVIALVAVAFLDVDAQRHLAPGHRRVAVLNADQVAGHQGEEVARLAEGVDPARQVPAVAEVLAVHQVAVGEQDRVFLPVGDDCGGVGGHDVGPVRVVGDLAEALRLALRAVDAAGLVEALERGIVLGTDPGDDFEMETLR